MLRTSPPDEHTNSPFIVSSVLQKLEFRADVKGTNQKTGDLTISLKGMSVNMQHFPPKVPNGVTNGMLMW